MIIGERLPVQNSAKGLMERTFSNTVYFGKPAFDIKEVLNPTETGGREYKDLYNEIIQFRKILFAYRLMHFTTPIENIDIGITGRNKELVKPCLQLFSNPKTEEDKTIKEEIKKTFETLLRIKNNKKAFTLEAALLPLIIELMERSKTKTISFSEFWNELQNDIRGYFDEKRPHEYQTEDYGTIYRNTISSTLQKLGVDSKRHNAFTEIIFNVKKIMKNASQYNLSLQTKLDPNGEHGDRSEDLTECHTGDQKMLDNDNRHIDNVKVNTNCFVA